MTTESYIFISNDVPFSSQYAMSYLVPNNYMLSYEEDLFSQGYEKEFLSYRGQ